MDNRPATPARTIRSGIQRHCRLLVAVTALVLTACLYWSVREAGFVGVVDRAYFHDFAWLRSASIEDILFGNFYKWSNYFRPLVVAFFVVQERIFDVAPGPMHLVSLGLHLANMLLVGLLAHRLVGQPSPGPRGCALVGLALLLYGIHPALVEPVVSISCQFDLVVVLLMLLGLIAHISIERTGLRALAVSVCFFLAACAKESAVVFPMLAAVCDWTTACKNPGESNRSAIRRILLRQWPVYLAVFCAGLAYLALRSHALGLLVDSSTTSPAGFLSRLQTASWLYLTYWRILLWPMAALSPIHEASTAQFSHATSNLLVVDIAAGSLVLAMIWLLARRKPLGCFLAAVSIALLPVLRIVPIDFDSSLYHERYAMTAIAMGCASLPFVLARTSANFASARFTSTTIAVLATAWLLLAGLNISVTLPLWIDETKLWTWVVVQQPDSLLAKNFLLNAHLLHDDYERARPVAESIAAQGQKCPVCLLNVANFALGVGDSRTARTSLDRAAPLLRRLRQPRLDQAFEMASAQLLELENEPASAEDAYRRALAVEPMNPAPRIRLAILLARRGQRDEASAEAQRALALMAPDEREKNMELYRRSTQALDSGPDPKQ